MSLNLEDLEINSLGSDIFSCWFNRNNDFFTLSGDQSSCKFSALRGLAAGAFYSNRVVKCPGLNSSKY